LEKEFNHPEDGYHNFFESWLRIALNIGQAGKPVVIFGAGFGVPAIWNIWLNDDIFRYQVPGAGMRRT
jgi:hypothetical protein